MEIVKQMLLQMTKTITDLTPSMRECVTAYLALPKEEQKALLPYWDNLRKAGENFIKAFGTSWWVKVRPFVKVLAFIIGFIFLIGLFTALLGR